MSTSGKTSVTSSFTLTPVSNASMATFSNNTLASFTNLQPSVVELNRSGGLWEVALLEISWPGTILNVTEGVLETASSLDLDEDDSISSSSGENSLEYESFGEEEGEGENNDDNNNNIEGGDTDTEIKEEETEYKNPPQKFFASVNENLIEPRKAAFLSVISRDKRLPLNCRKASTSIKKSPKISRYYLKPGYFSTIDGLLDKVCQKAFKTKNKNSWPFSWTVRTHDQSLRLAPRQSDQDSKQHETKIDDSTTNADNYYATEDDDDANGERPPVASIRLISSDMQNILGTKCLRWAEAKDEDGGGGGGSSMKSRRRRILLSGCRGRRNLHLRNGQLIL